MTQLFKRIDTVFLKVNDLDKAIQWYTEVLGFSLRWKIEGYAALNISETPLTLVQGEQPFEPRKDASFNFYVADVEAAVEHLKNNGVEVGPVESGDGVQWFAFQDLDGNRLEVCHFKE